MHGTKREPAVGNVIQGPWSAPAPTGADESERQRLAEEIAAQIVASQGSVVRWTAELADVEVDQGLNRHAHPEEGGVPCCEVGRRRHALT